MEISIAHGHGEPRRALTYERGLIKGRAAEQQDAADEVRAFTMAALAADLGVRRTFWSAAGGRDEPQRPLHCRASPESHLVGDMTWSAASEPLLGAAISAGLVAVHVQALRTPDATAMTRALWTFYSAKWIAPFAPATRLRTATLGYAAVGILMLGLAASAVMSP